MLTEPGSTASQTLTSRVLQLGELSTKKGEASVSRQPDGKRHLKKTPSFLASRDFYMAHENSSLSRPSKADFLNVVLLYSKYATLHHRCSLLLSRSIRQTRYGAECLPFQRV